MIAPPAGAAVLLAIVLAPVLLLGLVAVPQFFWLSAELSSSFASAISLCPEDFQRPPPLFL